jgi:hypothetical protein
METIEAVPEGTEYYNDAIVFKVYESLRRTGLSDDACKSAVNQMMSDGIVFRKKSEV